MNIHIGDIIILHTKAGYMRAEGLLIEDVSVSNRLSNFEDSLFCIHLQRQYSAQKEYTEMLLANANAIKDTKTDTYLAALKVRFKLFVQNCLLLKILFRKAKITKQS